MQKIIENALEFFSRVCASGLIHGNSSKDKLTETKKCSKCLRRVELSYAGCPYCGTKSFIFDDV